ncbi:MAG: glycosyltransferase family 4 protein [Flavobacteriales bacterium]
MDTGSRGKQRVVLVAPALNGSIQKDLDTLALHYRVTVNVYNWRRKALVPFYVLHQLLILALPIASARSVIIEFGGYWALVPSFLGRLLRKPVFIVLRGTDSAAMNNPPYGSLRTNPLRTVCRWSYNHATALVPVSASLEWSAQAYAGSPQGVKFHFPELQTPFRVIPNGFDALFWGMDESAGRPERQSHTVIAAFDNTQFDLKGGPLIVAAAQSMPEVDFVVVGADASCAGSIPANLRFVGRCSREQMRTHFQQAVVHLQLSYFEAFGNALAEAMLCGCIPIVSDVNNLPEISGGLGYVLSKPDADELVRLLTLAMANATDEQRRACKNHISEYYPLSRRATELIRLIEKG